MCLDLNTSRSPFWSGPPRFRPQHVRALGVALVEKPSCGHPVRAKADQQSTHRTQSRKRVTQALSRVRHELRRQTPKVGAGCSNWARPDPCGGCPAMGIPTAILGHEDAFLRPKPNARYRFSKGTLAGTRGNGRATVFVGSGVAHRSCRVMAGAARHRAMRGCGLDPARPLGAGPVRWPARCAGQCVRRSSCYHRGASH